MGLIIDSVSGAATVPTSASAHITISPKNATSTFQEEASTNRKRSTGEAGKCVHEKPCSKRRKRNDENFKNSPLSLKDGKMKAMHSTKVSNATSEKKAKGLEKISQNKSSKTMKENGREDEIASQKKAKENVGTEDSPKNSSPATFSLSKAQPLPYLPRNDRPETNKMILTQK